IFDPSGLARTDVTAETPLGDLSAFENSALLRDGDTIYIRGGEYVLENPIKFQRDNLTLSAYPDEQVTIRHGSHVYDWSIQINRDNFHMSGLDIVGNMETPDGRLYSHLLVRINGDNAVIENNVFRHNANFLPPEEGGDIAFGERVNRSGVTLSERAQLWGRTVLFDGSQGSVFRGNVVAALDPDAVANWKQDLHQVEGLMTDNSEVLIENNQFGPAGHHSLSSRFSTNHIRNNSFGDVSDYAHLLDFELSDHVKLPATHTAASLYANDGSIFEGNVVVYNTADPDDTGYGVQVQGTTNSDIFNNLFVDSHGTGHAVNLGIVRDSTEVTETAYNRVFNNTFYNVTSPISLGYFHGRAPEGGTAIHDNEIFGNVITYSDAKKTSIHDSVNSPIRLNLGDPIGGNGNRIENNLIYDYDSDIAAKSLVSTGTVHYTGEEFNALSFVNGNIFDHPVFAWSRGGDFRLHQSLSIDSNNDLTLDLTGQPRANGSLGAFSSFAVYAPASVTEEAEEGNAANIVSTETTMNLDAKKQFLLNSLMFREIVEQGDEADGKDDDFAHKHISKASAALPTESPIKHSPRFLLESLHKQDARDR
ncbi:MAG: hypothetical protein AAF497_22680, partial [Planctomycetota bacterium]